jgi:hypothetical protein
VSSAVDQLYHVSTQNRSFSKAVILICTLKMLDDASSKHAVLILPPQGTVKADS